MIVNHYGDLSLWCRIMILHVETSFGGATFVNKSEGVLVCPKVTDILLADLNRICEEAENRLKPKHVPLPTYKLSQIPLVVPQKRRKSSIENAFNVDDRKQLRETIARMFYSGGLSFRLARNPYCLCHLALNFQGIPRSFEKAATIFMESVSKHMLSNNNILDTLCANNIDGNENVYNECNWITKVVDDVSFIKTFIMTHSMALAILNEFSTLKLFSIGEIYVFYVNDSDGKKLHGRRRRRGLGYIMEEEGVRLYEKVVDSCTLLFDSNIDKIDNLDEVFQWFQLVNSVFIDIKNDILTDLKENQFSCHAHLKHLFEACNIINPVEVSESE
ncbi:hypothetical protein MTR_2g070750 [Medicago truncatula]|uniref:Uncharacterized protein n=1 Tax=Medicago truncatula TaxID=3880 RepID=A0A072VA03_MEDTR|nr:hypothetical protein MTR_2g070750 [Medicago truncatula]